MLLCAVSSATSELDAQLRYSVPGTMMYNENDDRPVAEAVLYGQTIDEYVCDGDSAKEFAAMADTIEGVL